MVGRQAFPFEKALFFRSFCLLVWCFFLWSQRRHSSTHQHPIRAAFFTPGHAVRHAMLGLGHKKSDQCEMLDYDNLYLYQLMFFGNEVYSIHINNQQNGYRL